MSKNMPVEYYISRKKTVLLQKKNIAKKIKQQTADLDLTHSGAAMESWLGRRAAFSDSMRASSSAFSARRAAHAASLDI